VAVPYLVQVDKVNSSEDWYVYKQYVWDLRYIDSPVYRLRDDSPLTGASLDEQLYYTTDANMNVTAVINASTGSIEERYTYDPYGKVTFREPDFDAYAAGSQSSVKDNRILFAGYRYDSETGLSLARHRILQPLLGRWTTTDPAGYIDSSNLYQYCVNNPTLLQDPMGLKSRLENGWDQGDHVNVRIDKRLKRDSWLYAGTLKWIEHADMHGIEVYDSTLDKTYLVGYEHAKFFLSRDGITGGRSDTAGRSMRHVR
jgi:RHS repeat-associated protein